MAKRTWNFGMPRKGEKTVSYRDVRVTRAGRTWTASYHVDEDGRLVISSAWGSRKSGDPGLEKRDAAAEALLGQMIDERLAHDRA